MLKYTLFLNFAAINVKNIILENVAIAMHCNLRPPDAASVVLHFNWDASATFEVGQPGHRCLITFLLLIGLRYVTL